MRSLVLYYSQTGNTKKVAELLAKAMGADIARYTCPGLESGLLGGLRMAWTIFTGGAPKIALPKEARDSYHLVIIASPVWAARPAPPLRSALRHRPPLGKRQAVFLTCDGTSERFPGERALQEAQALCALPPVGSRLFKAADINGPLLEEQVTQFAAALQQAMNMPVAGSATSSVGVRAANS